MLLFASISLSLVSLLQVTLSLLLLLLHHYHYHHHLDPHDSTVQYSTVQYTSNNMMTGNTGTTASSRSTATATTKSKHTNKTKKSKHSKGGSSSSSSISTVVMAMMTALLAWIAFYGLASQALVVWHWELVNPPPIEQMVETRVEVPYEVLIPGDEQIVEVEEDEYEIGDDEEEEEEVVVVEVPLPPLPPRIVLDEDSKLRQLQLIRQIAEAQAQQSNLLAELKQRVNVLEYNSHAANTAKDATEQPTQTQTQHTPPPESVSIDSLTTLLMKTTLQTTDDEALETLLLEALKELEAAIEFNVTTTSSTSTTDNNNNNNNNAALLLTQLLTQTPFVRDKPIESDANNCPPVPDGARHSDLRATLSTMLHGLTEQRKGRSVERLLFNPEDGTHLAETTLEEQIKAALPEGIVDMESIDDDDDDEVVVTAPTPAPTTATNDTPQEDKICLLPDDLEAMVELAMTSHAVDLQIALTKFVQQIEPDSKLILDAVLPSKKKSSSTKTKTPSSTNLRQALNSEFIWQTATSLVDAVIDQCGGYFEPLDAAVDSLVEGSSSSDNGDASVGRVVVARLLQAAAAVPVPAAAASSSNHQNQSKAGMLLHHT